MGFQALKMVIVINNMVVVGMMMMMMMMMMLMIMMTKVVDVDDKSREMKYKSKMVSFLRQNWWPIL